MYVVGGVDQARWAASHTPSCSSVARNRGGASYVPFDSINWNGIEWCASGTNHVVRGPSPTTFAIAESITSSGFSPTIQPSPAQSHHRSVGSRSASRGWGYASASPFGPRASPRCSTADRVRDSRNSAPPNGSVRSTTCTSGAPVTRSTTPSSTGRCVPCQSVDRPIRAYGTSANELAPSVSAGFRKSPGTGR